ncbi:hypothetical protein [Corynebacterium sp. H130]|uniref:hypothetical protein n=1 Tax=Corynebacterium sp. H130 TaxID=3133444 RepID=UPI0030B5A9D1
MKDPTRIAPVMSALQDLWEALPDMEFSDILRLLESEGFESLDDHDALQKLHALSGRFPRTLGYGVRCATVSGWLITMDDRNVAVWRSSKNPTVPVVWPYQEIVSGQVGYPLHVVDTEDQHRRFGLIEAIRPVDTRSMSMDSMPTLHRGDIGDAVYLLTSTEGQKLLIGRSLQLFDVGRRDTECTVMAWQTVYAAAKGQDVRIELANGAGQVAYSAIEDIYRLR